MLKTFKVIDLKSADICLSQIAKAAREIKRIETDRDGKIAEIKLECEEDLLELREQIEEYEIALQEFGDANKELFVKPRSHVLTFGVIGFSEGTKLETVKKMTWKKVVNKLLKLKKRSALRFAPSVIRERLKTWSEEDFKKIGVKKTTEDHFSYSLHEG